MIIEEFINVKPNSTTLSYYRNLGYEMEIRKETKVKVTDLTPKSHALVKYKCDYCGDVFEKPYHLILKGREKINKDCCDKCKHIKEQEICLLEKGVKSVLALKETQDKVKQTMNKKYGCDYPIQNLDIREKIKNTNIEKYGVDNPMKNQEIYSKTKSTNLKKYNSENVLNSNSTIRSKAEYLSLLSKSKNGTFPSSIPQNYINKLYNGKINYLIGYYAVDILLDNNIYCEYDGSGHRVNLKYNEISEKDFNNKQRKRYFYLKSKGYKLFRIINENNKDKLPSDDILLHMKEIAFQYLQQEDCNFINFNIDNGFIQTKHFTFYFDFYNDSIEKLKNCLLEITQIGKTPIQDNTELTL